MCGLINATTALNHKRKVCLSQNYSSFFWQKIGTGSLPLFADKFERQVVVCGKKNNYLS